MSKKFKGFGSKKNKIKKGFIIPHTSLNHHDLLNQYSMQFGSTMIHEKDYVPMNCCLCGQSMPSIHDTHNPYPLAPHCYAKEALENNNPNRCCIRCNDKVTQARVNQLLKNMEADSNER